MKTANKGFTYGIASAALLLIAALAVTLTNRSANPDRTSTPPFSPLLQGEGPGERSETLAKLYPANSATRYARIAPVADGFAPPDMQPGLNNPNSRWKNPAKTVQPVFPKSFNNPVRVRSGVADVSAVPLNANPDSAAELDAAGNLVYPNAFGPGIDIVYRCEPLKTEEFIVIQGERNEPPSPLFPLPLREGVGGGVRGLCAFSWELCTGSLKPRLTPAHTIELCDESAVPRLRINAPEGKDASGKLLRVGKELRITLEGNRVTLAADTRGLNFPIVIDPTWSSTSVRSITTNLHSLSTVPGGVLVAGGNNVANTVTTCERYDLASNTWAVTGSLNTARAQHAAVTLDDGKILVVGGASATVLSSCEIYNPATGTWAPTASMSNARAAHTLTRLANGTLLVTGGSTGGTETNTCEIFDPATPGWTPANPMGTPRADHTACLLNDGTVLIAGGMNSFGPSGSTLVFATCELFDSGNWTNVGPMATVRRNHAMLSLSTGNVLVTGGSALAGPLKSCEEYDLINKTWSTTTAMQHEHAAHIMLTFRNGRFLVNGGSDPQSLCEAFRESDDSWEITASLNVIHNIPRGTILENGAVAVTGDLSPGMDIFSPAPTASAQAVNVHSGGQTQVSLTAVTLENPLSFTITSQPSHGELTGTAPNLTYHANASFSGADTFTFKVNDGFLDSESATVNIDVTNTAPILQNVTSSSQDPRLPGNQPAVPNQIITFFVTASDPDGDALSYSWDFGDGSPPSNEQSPTHSYAEVGDYLAKVTVSDPAGAIAKPNSGNGSFWTNIVQVLVSKAPTVRVQTSDVVAFATQPFTFDASTSTDPENAIASYDWDFGDGTPHGSGQVISKIYDQPGTYTIKLTITDSAGVSSSLTRIIEVLGASEAGLFNGFMNYKVSWNRTAENKDSLTLDASVNVGDDVIGAGTPVALEIVGQRFEGTLDNKLRDFTNVNEKWQVKANIRRQTAGTVSLKLTLKKVSIGAAFNLSGVTVGGDPHDIVSKDVPVHLEVGTRSFEMLVPSDFKFSGNGTRAKGDGASD